MRYLFFIALAMSIPPLTDWIVDREFHLDGSHDGDYSQSQVDALSDLIARSRTRAEEKAERIALYPTKADRDRAIADVFMAGR